MKKIKVNFFRVNKKGLEKAFGKLEAEIMELAWLQKKASVRQVYQALCQSRKIAYTTVMTVMTRLADKGFLEREKDGKRYLYRPTLSKEELNQSFARTILSGMTKDLAIQAFSHFVDNLSSEDETILNKLEKLIEEKRNKSHV